VETDSLLENCEIKQAKQKHRQNIWNKIWFGIGAVVGLVVSGVF